MAVLNYILLAVRDPLESARLYNRLLGAEPVHSASDFVLYALPTGLKIGLWATGEMQPPPLPPGGSELTFSLPDVESVRSLYAVWVDLGLSVLQEPTETGFGFTFVLADPDGHRLRAFVRAENPS